MAVQDLPQQATPFVGRQHELAAIASLLDDPDCRLLTMVGPGGIGKTQLAICVANRHRERFADGVFFVPLQSLNSPAFIVSAIANAVDFHFHPGGDSRQQLLDFLQDKTLLLLLDNFEHLLDGADLLPEMLASIPCLRLIVSSRERLNLREEWVFEVGELAYPSTEAETDIEPYDAVQLFVQHARRVQAGFELTSAQKPAVIRICQSVGGMPLGIELAAAWTRALPAEEIARQLTRSLDILQTSVRNIEPRHRNIRAAFEPMWNRLSDELQAVFRKLSVFHGGFSRKAAEQVAGASLPALSALVDRSLVRMDTNGRYDLHELLRQYAEERLGDVPGEWGRAREQHCRFFTTLLAQKEHELNGRQQKAALDDIQREIDNVRAAWQWAVEQKCEEAIADAAHSLWFFYDIRSWYQEGAQAFGAAADALGANDPHGPRSKTLAKILVCYGGYCFSLNMPEKARMLIEEGLAIARAQQAMPETGFALLRLSEVAMFLEDNAEAAQDYLRESLAIFEALGNRWGIAYSLRWLGFVGLFLGAYREAQALAEQTLAMAEESGEQWGKALALNVAAHSAIELAQYQLARQLGDEVRALIAEINLRWSLPIADLLIGAAECGLGNFGPARHYLYAGLSGSSEIGFLPFVLHGLQETADWLIATGNRPKAVQILSFLLAYPIPPVTGKLRVRQRVATLQSQLPPSQFEDAVNQGQLLDLDTVVRMSLNDLASDPEPADMLSEREVEIVRLIANGFSNRQIADELILSLGTVKWYLHHIYSKLGVASRTQAVARARDLSLLSWPSPQFKPPDLSLDR